MRTYYRTGTRITQARQPYDPGSIVQWAIAESMSAARDLPEHAWGQTHPDAEWRYWVAPERPPGRKPKPEGERAEMRQFRCPAVLWGRAEREAARRGCNGVGELLRQLILALPE